MEVFISPTDPTSINQVLEMTCDDKEFEHLFDMLTPHKIDLKIKKDDMKDVLQLSFKKENDKYILHLNLVQL